MSVEASLFLLFPRNKKKRRKKNEGCRGQTYHRVFFLSESDDGPVVRHAKLCEAPFTAEVSGQYILQKCQTNMNKEREKERKREKKREKEKTGGGWENEE